MAFEVKNIKDISQDFHFSQKSVHSIQEMFSHIVPVNLKKYDLLLSYQWARRLLLFVVNKETKKFDMASELSFAVNTIYLYYNSCIDYIYQITVYQNLKKLKEVEKKRNIIEPNKKTTIYDFDINDGVDLWRVEQIEEDMKIVDRGFMDNFCTFKGNSLFHAVRKEGANLIKHKKIIKVEDAYFGNVPHFSEDERYLHIGIGTCGEFSTEKCIEILCNFNNILIDFIENNLVIPND